MDTIIPPAASFTFSPDASTIYASTSIGVFKSTDGGLNWGETNTNLRVFDIEALVGDPINPSTVYAGGNEGLFKSVYRRFSISTPKRGRHTACEE